MYWRTITPTRSLVCLALLLIAPIAEGQASTNGSVVAAYWSEGSSYDRNFQVADINGSLLTHVIFGFIDVDAEGNCRVPDPFAAAQRAFSSNPDENGSFGQLRLLKRTYPHLKTIMTVGGWTFSKYFSTVAASPAARANFAVSCLTLARSQGFDGIDIDWEFPTDGGLEGNIVSPNDKQTLTLLLQSIRAQMTTDEILTIAYPIDTFRLDIVEIDKIADACSWINVMSYNRAGVWSSMTQHHSPLDSTPLFPDLGTGLIGSIEEVLKRGVPKSKLVIGIPFYGVGWDQIDQGAHNGLFVTNTKHKSFIGQHEYNVFEYSWIKKLGPDWEFSFDNASGVPWAYNHDLKRMISYEDATSVRLKALFVQRTGLRGVFAYEISQDADQELVHAMNLYVPADVTPAGQAHHPAVTEAIHPTANSDRPAIIWFGIQWAFAFVVVGIGMVL